MIRAELSRLIGDSVDIPSLPSTLSQLREILQDKGAGVAEAAEVLAQDPPVSARVLRLANTAFYAPREKIASIKHAAAVLGMVALENLVIESTLIETFSCNRGETVRKLWRHSTLTAQTTQALAKRCKKGVAPLRSLDDLYTCGLLHDIGKVILLQSLGQKYQELIDESRSRKNVSYLREKQILKYTHADVGALLAAQWGFPGSLVEAIEWHHLPSVRLRQWPHVAIVALADQVANIVQGMSFQPHAKLDQGLLASLGVPTRDIKEVLRYAEVCLRHIDV